jgi:hypothetical protein
MKKFKSIRHREYCPSSEPMKEVLKDTVAPWLRSDILVLLDRKLTMLLLYSTVMMYMLLLYSTVIMYIQLADCNDIQQQKGKRSLSPLPCLFKK